MKKHTTRPKKINSARPLRLQFIRSLFFVSMVCFFVFILVNIIASQLVSPLYTQTVEGNKKAATAFLQSIQALPVFPEVFKANSSLFNENLQDEVFSEQAGRSKLIRKLNKYLVYNPKSRDALFSLSLLYRQEGDNERADVYFKRAKELDPAIVDNR